MLKARAQIRWENLVELGKTADELARDVGGSYSYWCTMLTSGHKGFAEKTARQIEVAYGLTRGKLDGLDAKDSEPSARQLSPRAMALALKFDELPDDQEKDRRYKEAMQLMAY